MAPVRPNPTLSEDLISEILVRVPVKSLLQFQSVSKTWLSLIKHPAFVKSQLRHALTTQTHHTLVTPIVETPRGYTQMKTLLLHVDSRRIVAQLKFPDSRGELIFKVLGSFNGIVCGVTLSERETSWYIWNPAIRQSRLIPPFGICHASGFGYDPIDDDFKLVCVGHRSRLSAEVYSANRNVWRQVPDPISFPSGRLDVCINGFLFGIGEYGMMAFDLNKEVMNCAIRLPGGGGDDVYESYEAQAETRIIEFNKSIAVIAMWDNALDGDRTDRRLEKKINMWTLDDEACLRGGGVEASWTLMFSIDLAMEARLINGYFSNEELLLLVRNRNFDYMWISCNAYKKEAKIVQLPVEMAGHHLNTNVYKYTESLVSLAGFKQDNWNAGEDDN